MTIINFYKNTEVESLVNGIANCSIKIADKLSTAAIENLLGEAGSQNIQNETIQKLDLISNDIIIKECQEHQLCFGILSEENENPIFLDNL